MDGVFGIGAIPIPGFSAHIVDPDKPFLSDTGYRSFVGCYADPALGLTPDAAVYHLLAVHVEKSLKGSSALSARNTGKDSERLRHSSSSQPEQLSLWG
jgi:hypothetical protein